MTAGMTQTDVQGCKRRTREAAAIGVRKRAIDVLLKS